MFRSRMSGSMSFYKPVTKKYVFEYMQIQIHIHTTINMLFYFIMLPVIAALAVE